MNYSKSLFFNFLTVFFANHILPGIEVMNQMKIPHLGTDVPFALVLGALNFLIYPILKMIDHRVNAVRIGAVAVFMNFAIYALLKVLPIGIHITSIEGYLIPSLFVAIGGFTTNYMLLRAKHHSCPVTQHHAGGVHHHSHSINPDDTQMPE